MPASRIEVTAQRAEIKLCPGWGAENRGGFPAEVTGRGQYGTGVKTGAASFQSQPVVPVERPAQFVADRRNHRLAEAPLIQGGQAWSRGVAAATAAGETPWRPAEGWHPAASGVRGHGKRHGLPGAATDRRPDDAVHAHRSQAAMAAAGLLPECNGTARPDQGPAYVGDAGCTPALGNAPPLRELQFIAKQEGQGWAAELADWLLDIKKMGAPTREHSPWLPADLWRALERRYDRLIRAG